jgi:poly-gamma-glutamate synthesis protein (capsule biosynthesis protein)
MIGIPLVIGLCVFLYLKTDQQKAENVQDLPVSIKDFDEEEAFFEESTDMEATANEASIKTSGSVTLSFAGDVHFSELILQNYDKNGILGIVDHEMLSYMQNTDLFVLNHEFVFSTGGEAMEDKEYTLRNDPKYVKILQELGTDVVSIANNHILDFGQEAFLDTLATLEDAEIEYAGGGRNLERALAPVIKTINGQTFAIFAATRVSPSYDWYANSKKPGILQTYDATDLNNAIAEANSLYDHVIVFAHWGIEREEYPQDYQRTLAKGYIDHGADLVIGAHPHILQGFEYYKNVPICYSLGNYLFGNRTGETLLLNAIFDENGQLSIELIPCERENYVLTKIQEPTKLFNYLTDISFDAAVSHGGILIE